MAHEPTGCDGILDHLRRELAREEGILVALREEAERQHPSAAELAAAPILEFWEIRLWPVPFLIGLVDGHPDLNGPVIRTSELQAFAPELGWARTLNRFYRIGPILNVDRA